MNILKYVSACLFCLCCIQSPAHSTFYNQLARAAEELTANKVIYDPSYRRIVYPNGDVPADRGVCTDVIIRAYRKLGIDLQKEVHEDMSRHFNLYPKIWGLRQPDRNIDHRRVPNLMTFFERYGQVKKLSQNPRTIRRETLCAGTSEVA